MAKNNAVQFYLPPGRIVMGDVSTLQTKDQQGRDREHPTIFFGVAVEKNNPHVSAILQQINQVANQYYANNATIMEQIRQGLAAPNFAWKVDDGDSVKNKDREGFAGCWVFRFSTSITPIKCGDQHDTPIDPAMIKCGYYVDVVGSVAANTLTDKNAGVYLNPNGVRLLGYGKEIQSGPSIGQLFAGRAAALPAGASTMPVAAPPAGAPGPMTQPGAPAGMAPLAAGATPLGGPTPPAPAAPPPAAPPPAPVAPVQTAETIEAESVAIDAAAGVQHYVGHRINAARTAYEPNPTPVAPIAVTPPAPMGLGGPAVAAANPTPPASAAPALGVPAGAAMAPGAPALGTPPLGSPTASPSNVQPHPQFLNPPAAPVQTPDEISAAIAAANGVQHYPGYRFDPATRAYRNNPPA